ncbi:hypothetical protein GCM10007167_17740 [Vulcaniibacterium thermophilum]|uniref:Uncharacterized protein n=1 Tax=Vulcaniibacterium thermophilum TaxID=1169913 RepID=A0A918Z460_9GAMM|nr:hypothetical protein GCM10007167_17740 [Vulcaniibacterium thermophilum]
MATELARERAFLLQRGAFDLEVLHEAVGRQTEVALHGGAQRGRDLVGGPGGQAGAREDEGGGEGSEDDLAGRAGVAHRRLRDEGAAGLPPVRGQAAAEPSSVDRARV